MADKVTSNKLKVWYGTQTQYDAITIKDTSTQYNVNIADLTSVFNIGLQQVVNLGSIDGEVNLEITDFYKLIYKVNTTTGLTFNEFVVNNLPSDTYLTFELLVVNNSDDIVPISFTNVNWDLDVVPTINEFTYIYFVFRYDGTNWFGNISGQWVANNGY